MKELTCLFVLCFIALVSAEAEWSEWKPLGLCTARPCNCHHKRTAPTCTTGKRVEIRFCNRSMDDPPCGYDTNGPLRLNEECENNGKNCPGWSDWRDVGFPCICDKWDNHYMMKQEVRYCNNPPWNYNSVKCPDKDGNLIAEEEERWSNDDRQCTCDETTTPIPTETPTTIPAKCKDYYDGYGGDYEDNWEVTPDPEVHRSNWVVLQENQSESIYAKCGDGSLHIGYK